MLTDQSFDRHAQCASLTGCSFLLRPLGDELVNQSGWVLEFAVSLILFRLGAEVVSLRMKSVV